MQRILFVDDEKLLLDGIARGLHRERGRWEMAFAPGGAAALELIDRERFDVVVSDLRMPGMDGVAVLGGAKTRQPAAARILLTGGADSALFTRALPVAHQFLSKPCPLTTLRATIDRTCELQALLQSPRIRDLAGGIEQLPSTPDAYAQFALAAGADGLEIDIDRISAAVERDPALCARVLQMANSAFLGFGEPISSVRKAVHSLGVQRLRGLFFASTAFGAVQPGTLAEGFRLETVQECSLVTARAARRLVADPDLADDAFTAGMLHDIGWIVLALTIGPQLGEIIREAHASKTAVHVVEQAVLGTTHAEVGAYLLGTWGLPYSVVEAVAYHHRPSAAGRSTFGVLGAVHVGDALAECVMSNAPDHDRLDEAFIEGLGLGAHVDLWRRICGEVARG